jgi:hypothetical protein
MIPERLAQQLEGARRVLLAGAGGGYDILGAVPLLGALKQMGLRVSLANLTFTTVSKLGIESSGGCHTLHRLTGNHASKSIFCPEAWLSRWLADQGPELIEDPSVWTFDPSGYHPLREAYRFVLEQEQIDTLILVDGGIDLLLRGDETSLGTPVEDLISLAVVRNLDVPRKIASAVGFGIELRDGIQHAQVLERFADLTRRGGYFGATAVVQGASSGDQYMDALGYVLEHQQGLRQSHVHRMIQASVRGEFGSDGPHIWVTPLMNLFWFFDLATLADTHLFLEHLEETNELIDVVAMIQACRRNLKIKDREPVPL